MRAGRRTASQRGIKYQDPAWKLYCKAKKLGTWDPADIDFAQDRYDWLQLHDRERDVILRLTSLFLAGEESVVGELLPLVWAISKEGRLEEEMYLATFMVDEAKHVEAFGRFLDEVVQHYPDLTIYHTPGYQAIFCEELPRSLNHLFTDQSPEALAQAGATYNLVVEGVLAETGYRAFHTMLRQRRILPGMSRMVGLIKRDEARHLAYGLLLLSRLIREHGTPIWEVVQQRMEALLEPALRIIDEIFASYETMPFQLNRRVARQFAIKQYEKRMQRLSSRI